MEGTDQEKILAVIKEKYEDQILLAEMLYDFPTITLKKDRIVEIIKFLYDHPATKFQFLTTLCGIHYPENNQIAIMYQLHNLVSNQRVRIKIYLPADNPVVSRSIQLAAGNSGVSVETTGLSAGRYIFIRTR